MVVAKFELLLEDYLDNMDERSSFIIYLERIIEGMKEEHGMDGIGHLRVPSPRSNGWVDG